MTLKITDVQAALVQNFKAGLSPDESRNRLAIEFPDLTEDQLDAASGGLKEEFKFLQKDDEEVIKLGQIGFKILDKAELLSGRPGITFEEAVTFLQDHGDQEAGELLEELGKRLDP